MRGARLAVAGILACNIVLWLLPSNVLELVARGRHVLLGRYSIERLTSLIGLLAVSVGAVYLLLADGENRKPRVFQLVMLAGSLLLAVLIVDTASRVVSKDSFYVIERDFIRRVPGLVIEQTYHDRPLSARSYPVVRPGYRSVDWTFSSDSRGYRNAKALDQAEIVVLGDSFAEGTKVSDAEVWPVRLAHATGRTVYSLAMSGEDPSYYLAALERFGIGLKPETVICLIYEGNDFRGSGRLADPLEPKGISRRLVDYFKGSPLRMALRRGMAHVFGPINSNSSFRGQQTVAWLPLEVAGRYYAFAPKRVIQLYQTKAQQKASPGFKTVLLALAQLRKLCQRARAELIVVYAPSKARVVLPLARQALPAADVLDYIWLRRKKLHPAHRELPPPDVFLERLLRYAESTETALAEACAEQRIPLLSLTPGLRRAAAAGQQVYYTYDQHWTPLGNQLVAEEVARALSRPAGSPRSDRPAGGRAKRTGK